MWPILSIYLLIYLLDSSLTPFFVCLFVCLLLLLLLLLCVPQFVVSLKNVVELLAFSWLYNADQLKDVCVEFICHNLSSLVETRFVASVGFRTTLQFVFLF